MKIFGTHTVLLSLVEKKNIQQLLYSLIQRLTVANWKPDDGLKCYFTSRMLSLKRSGRQTGFQLFAFFNFYKLNWSDKKSAKGLFLSSGSNHLFYEKTYLGELGCKSVDDATLWIENWILFKVMRGHEMIHWCMCVVVSMQTPKYEFTGVKPKNALRKSLATSVTWINVVYIHELICQQLTRGLWTLKQRKCHNEMSKLSKRQVKRQKNMDECQWYTFLNRRWISHWPWNSIICVYAKKIFKTFIVVLNVSSFSFLCEQSLLLPL